MTYDDEYQGAVRTFLIEAEALTQNQIDALTRADAALGKRAATKRAAASLRAAAARHCKALGQPPAKLDRREEMADAVIDMTLLALVEPRQQIKALEQRNDTLERRCADLENRLLEVEASRAALDHVR